MCQLLYTAVPYGYSKVCTLYSMYVYTIFTLQEIKYN